MLKIMPIIIMQERRFFPLTVHRYIFFTQIKISISFLYLNVSKNSRLEPRKVFVLKFPYPQNNPGNNYKIGQKFQLQTRTEMFTRVSMILKTDLFRVQNLKCPLMSRELIIYWIFIEVVLNSYASRSQQKYLDFALLRHVEQKFKILKNLELQYIHSDKLECLSSKTQKKKLKIYIFILP